MKWWTDNYIIHRSIQHVCDVWSWQEFSLDDVIWGGTDTPCGNLRSCVHQTLWYNIFCVGRWVGTVSLDMIVDIDNNFPIVIVGEFSVRNEKASIYIYIYFLLLPILLKGPYKNSQDIIEIFLYVKMKICIIGKPQK